MKREIIIDNDKTTEIEYTSMQINLMASKEAQFNLSYASYTEELLTELKSATNVDIKIDDNYIKLINITNVECRLLDSNGNIQILISISCKNINLL